MASRLHLQQEIPVKQCVYQCRKNLRTQRTVNQPDKQQVLEGVCVFTGDRLPAHAIRQVYTLLRNEICSPSELPGMRQEVQCTWRLKPSKSNCYFCVDRLQAVPFFAQGRSNEKNTQTRARPSAAAWQRKLTTRAFTFHVLTYFGARWHAVAPLSLTKRRDF